MHLLKSKCSVWWPKAPVNVWDIFPMSLQKLITPSRRVLKLPVGRHRHVAADAIDMNDAQTALNLLRKCLRTACNNHLLRVVTLPPANKQAALNYDNEIRQTFHQLVGRGLSNTPYRELTLPVSNLIGGTSTFRLGLATTADMAPVAYLSALSLRKA